MGRSRNEGKLGTTATTPGCFACPTGKPPPRRPRQHVAAFLSVWWVVGTSCFTFIAPFTIVGNGYFGSCLATFASVSLLCRYGTAQPRPTPLWCTPHALHHIPHSLQGLTHAPCQPGILCSSATPGHCRPGHCTAFSLSPPPRFAGAPTSAKALSSSQRKRGRGRRQAPVRVGGEPYGLRKRLLQRVMYKREGVG